MIKFLSERYLQISDPDAILWCGDLFYFDKKGGPDRQTYMLYIPSGQQHLRLMNILGHKAGMSIANLTFPSESGEEGAINLQLSWLRENWPSQLDFCDFASTRFYHWAPSQVADRECN